MALSTYTELQASLTRLSLRSDQADNWPDFIALAEAQMERELRVRPMLLRADATIDEEFDAFPDDMIEPVSFILQTDPVWQLDYIAPENINQQKFSATVLRSECASLFGSDPAPPKYYTVVGPQFQFFPAPEASYTGELTYYQRLPPLVNNAQNWLLYRHPDAYLYGALVQYGLAFGDERLGDWTSAYTSAIEAVRKAYPTPTNKTKLRTDLPRRRFASGWR